MKSRYDGAISEVSNCVVNQLRDIQCTLSVAESLTGGALASAIVDVPGASDVFLGGVVSYAIEAKAHVLQVSEQRLRDYGAVDPLVACDMANGVRTLFGSTYSLATTGVAGPGNDGAHPAGQVFIGVGSSFPLRIESAYGAVENMNCAPEHGRRAEHVGSDVVSASTCSFVKSTLQRDECCGAWEYMFDGDRSDVRGQTVYQALTMLQRLLYTEG